MMPDPVTTVDEQPRRRRLAPWAWVVMVVIALVAGAAIFYYLPLRHRVPPNLPANRAIGYFTAGFAPGSDLTTLGLELVRNRLAGPDTSNARQKIVRIVSDAAIPERVFGWIMPGSWDEKIAAIAVVDLPRLGRLIRATHRLFLPGMLFDGRARTIRVVGRRIVAEREYQPDDMAIRAYAFLNDTLLVATSPQALTEYLVNVDRDTITDPVFEESVTAHTTAPSANAGAAAVAVARPDAILLFQNFRGDLTSLVRMVEDRFAFAAIPSIDAMPFIASELTVEGSAANASIVFDFDDESRKAEVFSDVRFLYGTLRRAAKATELDLRGEIVDEPGRYALRFTIEGLDDLAF
jgi:hypothetical protein